MTAVAVAVGRQPTSLIALLCRGELGGQVTVHERTHTGDRPLQCPYCPMRFKASGSLHWHKYCRHADLVSGTAKYWSCCSWRVASVGEGGDLRLELWRLDFFCTLPGTFVCTPPPFTPPD